MAQKMWLTVDDVAQQLGVSTASVYQWVRKDKLKAHKVGKLLRFSTEDLAEFMTGEPQPEVPGRAGTVSEEELVDQLGQILRRIIREEMRA